MANVQNGYIRCVVDNTSPPNRIRELREALGMTQVDLARLANVTPSAINKLEMGTRGLDLDWMQRLAPLLGCAPADLLPRWANPDILDDEERQLVEARRAAVDVQRATFDRVSDAVIPWRAPPMDRAA